MFEFKHKQKPLWRNGRRVWLKIISCGVVVQVDLEVYIMSVPKRFKTKTQKINRKKTGPIFIKKNNIMLINKYITMLTSMRKQNY